MPELPEIENIVRYLDPLLYDRKILKITVNRPDMIRQGAGLLIDLPQRRIESVRRRGKYVLIKISDDTWLIFHLGMSGQLTLDKFGHPPKKHTHFVVLLEPGDLELRLRDPRRFGGIYLCKGYKIDDLQPLSKLGSEPLSLSTEQFHELINKSNRQLKALLMDQGIIAGLGNIYVNEALHRCRLHPRTRSRRLNHEKSAALLEAIKEVLKESIASGGSSIADYIKPDGSLGGFQDNWRAHSREGKPCPVCGHIIVKTRYHGRGTYICEHCQKKDE